MYSEFSECIQQVYSIQSIECVVRDKSTLFFHQKMSEWQSRRVGQLETFVMSAIAPAGTTELITRHPYSLINR